MSFQEITKGFRTDPEGGIAAPPFTQPRYKFNSDIAFMGNLRKMPGRYYLEEFFNQVPQLNANIGVATNLNFEILGTNAANSDVTFDTTTGGIKIATAGADDDQLIVLPHLDTKQTAWTGVKWGTENQVIWEAMISTGDDISTGVLYWAGLKLTNTPTVATDADQAFFRFSTDDSDDNWEIVYSIDGTDTTVDSGVEVEADTQYRFRIEIDKDRKAHFFINDKLIENTTALKNDVDLIPYVGIQALSATAEFMKLHYEKISRTIFE